MAANALKKITTRAKQIVKRHPNKKWASAIKEAGREYRAGKISGTRKKRVSGTRKKRTVRVLKNVKHCAVGARRRAVAAPRRVGSVRETPESMLKRDLKEKWGKLAVKHHLAKTKTEKKKILRQIVEIRKKLRALQ